MRRHKGEWIFTDGEVEQNEQQIKKLRRALKELLKWADWKTRDGCIMSLMEIKKMETDVKYAQRVLKKGK